MNQIITDEQAKYKAGKLRELNLKLKELEQSKKEFEDSLRDYVEATGIRDLGVMVAYEKTKPAKLVGYEGKKMENMQGELMTRFPDYVRKSLSVADIAKNIDADQKLAAFIAESGLGIVQESEIYFKSV